jgi:hypothetical protein
MGPGSTHGGDRVAERPGTPRRAEVNIGAASAGGRGPLPDRGRRSTRQWYGPAHAKAPDRWGPGPLEHERAGSPSVEVGAVEQPRRHRAAIARCAGPQLLLASRVRRGSRCSCWEPRPGGLIFSPDPTVADRDSVATSYTAHAPPGANDLSAVHPSGLHRRRARRSGSSRRRHRTVNQRHRANQPTDGLGRGSSTRPAPQELVQLRVGLGVELRWFASFAQLLE